MNFLYKKIIDSSKNALHAETIIAIIESGNFLCIELLEIDGISLKEYSKKINTIVQTFFQRSLDVEIDIYIVPWDIKSKNKEGICDGFAYKGRVYRIVISEDTDILHVIAHEISHVLVKEIYPDVQSDFAVNVEEFVSDLEKQLFSCLRK